MSASAPSEPPATDAGSDVVKPHLVIVGLMAVGKSTTATAVGSALGRAVHDSDQDLECVFGSTGADLALRHGVDELHRLEAAMLLGRLAERVPAVIAAAGWIVEDPRCRDALRNRATTVVLQAPVDELVRRAATGDHRRPIAASEVRALAERRAPLFASVADLELDATLPTERLVEAIEAFLAEPTRNSRPAHMRTE